MHQTRMRAANLRPDVHAGDRIDTRGIPGAGARSVLTLDHAQHLARDSSTEVFPGIGEEGQMPDVVDKATRSRMMAGIGSRDTVPELVLRRALHARGLRYRLHDRSLPGTPDMVFRRFGAVCFVHGCFWHRHIGCPYTTIPATRKEFWQAKFHANVSRDRRNQHHLIEAGWRVTIVWECELRKQGGYQIALRLDRWLHGVERTFGAHLASDG